MGKCGATATKFDNAFVDQTKKKSPCELFCNITPGYEQSPRVFEEIGVITNHANKKGRSKLENRETPCVYVGFTSNHVGCVYRMLNMTKQ